MSPDPNALARHDHPNRYFYELVDLFRRDTFVDDATFVYMSNFCLHARFRRNAKFEKQIIELVQYFQLRKEYFPIYCSIILASKFLTPAEIITLIEQTKVAWDQDFWLGPSVGGLTPRVLTDIAATNSFNRITQSVNNSDLDDVVGFHHRLRTDLSAVNRLFAYAKNENPTYPQKIYHPKSLVILSISMNPSATSQTIAIKKAHKSPKIDPFYNKWPI